MNVEYLRASKRFLKNVSSIQDISFNQDALLRQVGQPRDTLYIDRIRSNARVHTRQLWSRTKLSRKSNYPRVSIPLRGWVDAPGGRVRRDASVAQFHARSPIEHPSIYAYPGRATSAQRRFQLLSGTDSPAPFRLGCLLELADRNQRYNTRTSWRTPSWTAVTPARARAAILISLRQFRKCPAPRDNYISPPRLRM